MIGKAEILRIAGELKLTPHVVEKDYALGWLLAGIFSHETLADSWTFKGGTCLKKCFFETYRFSEDLDFTLASDAHLDEVFLKRVFAEVGDWVYERSGLELAAEKQSFDVYDNPRGNKSCQGKIGYRGPVRQPEVRRTELDGPRDVRSKRRASAQSHRTRAGRYPPRRRNRMS